MVKTIIQDQTMLFLVLVVAFFVGGSTTEIFSDYEADAKINITNIEIVEDFGIALSDTSSDDEGEYKDGDHVEKSCPFKNKKSASVNTDLNI
jgi:hypothetical protein